LSYLDDVCLPLIKLLDAASFHKGVQLAGYAANLDFWVGETRHAMDVLAGYEIRFQRLKDARTQHAALRREQLDETAIRRTVTDAESTKLDSQLRSTAQRFLKLCCEAGYIDHNKQREIEQLLGIRINYSREMT
jgi:hypothetical protein